MANANRFSIMFCQYRSKIDSSLREWCKANDFSISNVSKLERGLVNPPKTNSMLKRYALALKMNKEEGQKFVDLGFIYSGTIPTDLDLSDKNVNILINAFEKIRRNK